ncbi:MAG: hypothetical protein ABI321_07405 [Polyangia bacterium]
MTPLVARPLLARTLTAGAVAFGAGFVVLVGSFMTFRGDSATAIEAPVVEAPVVEVAVVETATLHAAVVAAPSQVTLELDVTKAQSMCEYYSVWDVQRVTVEQGTKHASFQRDFAFADGCKWRSEESVVEVEPGRYAYSYTEAPVSCRPHHVAAPACTRSGWAIAR